MGVPAEKYLRSIVENVWMGQYCERIRQRSMLCGIADPIRDTNMQGVL